MRRHKLIACAVLVGALSGTAAGQQAGVIIRQETGPSRERDIERSAVNFAARWRPQNATGVTKIVGTVIDIRQIPVAGAVLKLRNLDTGTIEQTSQSAEQGDYAFEVEESGTYVVEMVLTDGYVIALSNAGSLAQYETLNTVIQLPGRWDFSTRTVVAQQSVTSFFGMSAQTSMTSQTLQLAAEQEVKPTDPGRPVSPS
jgi:hypothetical protein